METYIAHFHSKMNEIVLIGNPSQKVIDELDGEPMIRIKDIPLFLESRTLAYNIDSFILDQIAKGNLK